MKLMTVGEVSNYEAPDYVILYNLMSFHLRNTLFLISEETTEALILFEAKQNKIKLPNLYGYFEMFQCVIFER
jgi:hypothetical protein